MNLTFSSLFLNSSYMEGLFSDVKNVKERLTEYEGGDDDADTDEETE